MRMHSLEYLGIDPKSFAVSSAMWAKGYRDYWNNCGWLDVEVYQCETFTVYQRRSPIDQRLIVEVTQFEMNVNALIARAFAHHVAPSVDEWETYVGRSLTALRQVFTEGSKVSNECDVARDVVA